MNTTNIVCVDGLNWRVEALRLKSSETAISVNKKVHPRNVRSSLLRTKLVESLSNDEIKSDELCTHDATLKLTAPAQNPIDLPQKTDTLKFHAAASTKIVTGPYKNVAIAGNVVTCKYGNCQLPMLQEKLSKTFKNDSANKENQNPIRVHNAVQKITLNPRREVTGLPQQTENFMSLVTASAKKEADLSNRIETIKIRNCYKHEKTCFLRNKLKSFIIVDQISHGINNRSRPYWKND